MAGDGRESLLNVDNDGGDNGASSKTPAAAIASGMPLIVTAADRRARAVYYSFTLLCIGLLVLLVVVLVESHKWRSTISSESEAWRNLMLKFEADLAKQFSAENNPDL